MSLGAECFNELLHSYACMMHIYVHTYVHICAHTLQVNDDNEAGPVLIGGGYDGVYVDVHGRNCTAKNRYLPMPA